MLGALLVAGGITVFATNFYRLLETDLFATILVIQSLPFLSAVATEVLERFSEVGNNKLGLAFLKVALAAAGRITLRGSTGVVGLPLSRQRGISSNHRISIYK